MKPISPCFRRVLVIDFVGPVASAAGLLVRLYGIPRVQSFPIFWNSAFVTSCKSIVTPLPSVSMVSSPPLDVPTFSIVMLDRDGKSASQHCAGSAQAWPRGLSTGLKIYWRSPPELPDQDKT